MTSIDDLPEFPHESWDVDAAWERVRSRTAPETGSFGHEMERAVRSRWRNVAYAAGAALVVTGAAVALIRRGDVPGASSLGAGPGQYSTSRAQYSTIRLADGSEVTLAPESRLTVAPRFAEGDREISLDGEAIFTVHHDAAHPLRVRARGVLIEDIGTRFDLSAYASDTNVTVAVAEGSVSMTAARSHSSSVAARAGPAIVLERGDIGRVDRLGRVSSERPASVAGYLAWANGRLSFTDRPLEEVLRTIGRWYDLDVRVEDARLKGRRVTADFSPQAPAEMIDALAVATDAVVARDGRVITLRTR